MTYTPTVNDYVKWTTALGMVHEGWVYYKSTPLDNVFRKKNGWREIDPYISIEVATKPRPQCDISTFLHKRIHVAYVAQRVVGTNWSLFEGGFRSTMTQTPIRFHLECISHSSIDQSTHSRSFVYNMIQKNI